MGKGLPFLWSATTLFLLLPLASSIITPCTQYNSMHSVGNGNCAECTKLYFNKEELSKNDFIMVKDPIGNFYPMARPIIPLLKKPKGDGNIESCYWCPELQLCGHPEDNRVLCPAPTDAITREQEQEQAAQQGALLEVAASTRTSSKQNIGGWVSKAECLDTVVNTRAKYEDELRTVAKQLRQASVEARKEFIRAEGRRSRRSVDIAVRETRNVHNRDSWYDCFGPCVSTGKSACSQETRKIMPKGADPSAREPVSKAPSLEPSEEPVVCELTVPKGVTSYRVHGRYSPGSQFWGMCHLIPCEAMEYGD